MEYHIALVKGDGIGPEIVDGAVAVLEEIGKKYDKSPAQVCINWMISNPALTAPIIGGTDDRHARQNLEAMSFRLSQEDYDTIDSVSKDFCSRLPESVLFFNSQIRE